MAGKLNLTDSTLGDQTEEAFRTVTSEHMSYWWFFREVIRGGGSQHLRKLDTSPVTPEEQVEFQAVGWLGNSAYMNICAAHYHFGRMQSSLGDPTIWLRDFLVMTHFKGFHSCLYSSITAVANTVCVVFCDKSPFGDKPSRMIWNWSIGNTINLVAGRGLNTLKGFLENCQKRMEIRDQLDHYWTIGRHVDLNQFFLDPTSKGHVILDRSQIKPTVDAIKLCYDYLFDTMRDFNDIYPLLSNEVDSWLNRKGLRLDYSDYVNHGRSRPTERFIT